MAIKHATIRDQTAGDAFSVLRAVPGLPAGRTLAKAWLTIKQNKTDPDAAAKLQLDITTAPTSEGQITDATGVAPGALTFTITAAQSAAIGAARRFYYDVQIKLDNGEIATLELGTLQLDQGITDATS
jgi:hypothetical protein